MSTIQLTTEDLETFFAKGLQNSCQATDELLKSIEASQNEVLAREALNLYQNHYRTLERPWDHETFMYGLGLIYMYFNAYNWAVKSFRDTIYTRPGFPRSRDVHTRLGLIFKSAGRYDLSEKHFNLAINDNRRDSGISTKSELKFHLAHLSELRGKIKQAAELYEKLLLHDKDLPPKISAYVQRQLGWINYTDATKPSDLPNSIESARKPQTDNLTSLMSSEPSVETCKNSLKLKKIDINLLSDDIKPPPLFLRHPPYPRLPSKMLSPLPPSIILDSKKELMSKRLQDVCQSNPISIVRNIASVLKLDLGLFSTKTLAETNPDQSIDIVSHLCNRSTDEAFNAELKTHSWICERHLSSSTISRYANYQVASLRQSLQDERDSKSKPSSNTKESETDSNESAYRKHSDSTSKHYEVSSASSKSGQVSKKFKKEPSKAKFVKSACMIDLSDDKKWRAQLNELNKLPHHMKCVSASNMLTHIGGAVPGLNTISVSMHVPGCKMIGYKTMGNFCAVNINTGPGDYEWCAIPGQYESIMRKLCNRNGCDMDRKNWWPPAQGHGMQDHGVPIYKFTQRPGDLVWINSGTLYWIQASGWANSIQWNLGPLSARQFQLASESYEMNKFLYRKLQVPLVQMTWNIVINIGFVVDEDLSRSFVDVMKRSLRYCHLIKDLVHETDHGIQLSDKETGPRNAKCCSLCENEVFNIFFEREHDRAVHCIECARRTDQAFKGYRVKQEYDLKYLARLYDSFISTRRRYQEMGVKHKNNIKS